MSTMPELPRITRELSAVGRVLAERHPYEETPDAFQWWAWDAQNVLDWVEAMPSAPADAVRCALLESGYFHMQGHDGDVVPEERACFDADVFAVLAAVPPEAQKE